jgi:hypothetical protein
MPLLCCMDPILDFQIKISTDLGTMLAAQISLSFSICRLTISLGLVHPLFLSLLTTSLDLASPTILDPDPSFEGPSPSSQNLGPYLASFRLRAPRAWSETLGPDLAFEEPDPSLSSNSSSSDEGRERLRRRWKSG